jgi:photosystem II stability/assembly factor-like uncharacterized protein
MNSYKRHGVFFNLSSRTAGLSSKPFLWLMLIIVPFLTSCGGDSDSDNTPVVIPPVALSISSQPTDQTVMDGAPAQFAVVATGAGTLRYQWRRNDIDLAGAQGSSYTLAAATLADSGASFSVQVSDDNTAVISASAALTVTPGPDVPVILAPAIVAPPTSTSAVVGFTVSFTVTASGTAPLAYQWQRNGIDLPGGTSSRLNWSAALADSGAQFRVVVSNAAGSVTSAFATLAVDAAAVAPTITTEPMAQSVEQGQQVSFSVVAAGTAPLSYQWQRNSTNIAGANAASYITPLLTQAADDGALYRVIVTNAVDSVTSTEVAVSVTQTLLACSGGAQAGWCWVEPKPHGNTLRDVQHLGDDVFVAAGVGGTFMRSTDGGATWDVTFAIGSNVNGMHFVDESVGFVVGDQGFIARTDDGGQTWTPQVSSVQTTLNDVHFFDTDLGLAVGDSNTILRTTDGGASWTPATVSPFGHAYGVSFADADIVVAVGLNGARLRSTDGGANWTRLDTPVDVRETRNLRSVTFTSDTTGFAVGGRSNLILRTDDAGLTWANVPGAGGDGSCGFEAISVSGANMLAAATCGWIAHSADSGATWTKVPAGGSKLETYTYGVAFGTGAVAIAVGAEGQFYRTTDAGVSWTTIYPERVAQTFWNVYFDNASTAYIVGTTSYKSVDAGLSWAQDTSLPRAMHAMTSVNGALITAGSNYSINRSVDGGLTWSNVFYLQSNSTLDSFYFYNASLGYAYGKTAGAIVTTDGGLTWNPQFLGLGGVVGIHFYSDLVGVYVGEGRIYRTVNGGANWSQVQYSQWRIAGAAFTGSGGVVVGANGTLFHTSDMGATWTLVAGVSTEHFRGVQTNSSGSLFIAYTESGNMLKSVDGSSWSRLASPVGGQINALRYYDDTLGLAVGDDGIILRTTTGGQ